MEPIRIVCPNCRGKLVVRTELLLGHTVPCPRCQSQVQIPDTPLQTVPSESLPASFDSSAITRIDDGLLAQQLAGEPTKGSLFDLDDQSFGSAIEAFRPLDEIPKEQAAVVKATEETPLVAFGPIESVAAEESSVTSVADWNPVETKRRRQILLVVMAGIATSILAIAGFAAFLRLHSQKPSLASRDLPIEEAPTEVSPPPAADASVPPPAADLPAKADSARLDGKPSETADASPPPTTDVNSPVMAENPVPAPSSELPEGVSQRLQAKSIVSPLASEASKGSQEKTLTDPATAMDVGEGLAIPESMRGFLKAFDPGSLRQMPDALASEKPASAYEVGAERIDVEKLYHPPSVTLAHWDTAQEVLVPRLATVKPVPLNAVLSVLGQLSGSGFSWELDAVRFSGFDIDAPLTLSLDEQRVGQIVEQICRDQRLLLSIDDQGLPQLRPDPKQIVDRYPSDWSLEDLGATEQEWSAWQELLTQLYPAWSQDWVRKGAVIEWKANVSPIRCATVAALLDQARVAYGIKPKSTFPSDLIDPKLGWETSVARLNKPGIRVIMHSLALPRLLETAARDVDLRLSIDWPVASLHGFSSIRSTTSLLQDRRWPEIAKWELEEFSLVAVVGQAAQLHLTALPDQRRMWRTVWIKLDKGSTVESIRESLRLISPTDDQGRSMLGVFSAPAPSTANMRWVVARVCAPNTQQLENRVLRDALQLSVDTPSSPE